MTHRRAGGRPAGGAAPCERRPDPFLVMPRISRLVSSGTPKLPLDSQRVFRAVSSGARLGLSTSLKTSSIVQNADSSLPEKHERIGDLDLEMSMLDGTWNIRRVVWTKSKISFARVGEELTVDSIPLDQVFIDSKCGARPMPPVQVMVQGIDSSSTLLVGGPSHASAKGLSDPTEKSIAACPRSDASQTFIKIHTVPNGFNSGRPYFLRFPHNKDEDKNPDEKRQAEEKNTVELKRIASELNGLAASERKRLEAKSAFERHQASPLSARRMAPRSADSERELFPAIGPFSHARIPASGGGGAALRNRLARRPAPAGPRLTPAA